MFLRYTHLGVGHPVALRRITKDCLDFESAALASEVMDVDEGKSASDEAYEEHEEADEVSEGELEDEIEELQVHEEDKEDEEDEEDDNDLSF